MRYQIKYILIICAMVLIVTPAVDAGINGTDDRAPINKHVKQFVKSYIQVNRKTLSNIKQRSHSPFTIIDSTFKHYGIPVQLKYLAVVESELKTKAVSRVGAVGPWQLMPGTARILGLKVNARHDERKDYYKSTRAAAMYLKDLHQEFGDWLLVFAAYNGGETNVYAAMHRSASTNYWKLQKYLPKETRDYVNKFIATCYYFEGANSLLMLTRSNISRSGVAQNEVAKQ
jgi:membrane-bound lytic murein transglycosylase D